MFRTDPTSTSNVLTSASQSWGSESFPIYNPFLTDSSILEAVSVGRTEKLIRDVTEKIVRDSGTKANRYILIEGNSGSGKTHFLARLCQNLRQERAANESLFVTNVSEGESVSSLSDLIRKICYALHSAYPQDFTAEWLTSSLNLDSRGLQDHLRTRPAHRKMLLLVESFDTTLTQLGMEGQSAFRAFLANDGRISIVATSKPTSRALFSDSNYRFHHNFDIKELQPFTREDAFESLVRLARATGKGGVAEYLSTEQGQGRISRAYELSRGNPRAFILLGRAIKSGPLEALEEEVKLSVAPGGDYFRSRTLALSSQQRAVIQEMCRDGRAMTAELLARQTIIKPDEIRSLLNDLIRLGYVSETRESGNSTYFVSDPMLSLTYSNRQGHFFLPV